MLKKSSSFVLASLRGSTYRSVRLTSSLTAAWLEVFLNSLQATPVLPIFLSEFVLDPKVEKCSRGIGRIEGSAYGPGR